MKLSFLAVYFLCGLCAHTEDLPGEKKAGSYIYQSLAEADDTEIFAFMGRGKTAGDVQQASITPTGIPDDFWKMPPEAAAMAYLEANRTEAHRSAHQLALPQVLPKLPEVYSISLSSHSALCYVANTWEFFVRVDPADSYVVFASSSAGGAVFYDVVHDHPAFNLRWCSLAYEDARQLAHVLVLLRKIQSQSKPERSGQTAISFISSTGDGGATLRISTPGAPDISCSGTLWQFAQISERWTGEYDDVAFVNFASHLISSA